MATTLNETELAKLHQSQAERVLAPNVKRVRDLQKSVMPEGGVDRLKFFTWDTIEVPGMGEDVIFLRGNYVIEREDPTSASWEEASVNIWMRELSVAGVSRKFGRVRVSVNDQIGKRSGGQVRPGTVYDELPDSPKMCEMYGYMQFEMLDAGITVFNKTAIELRHRITTIPPIMEGGGTDEGVVTPLYDVARPDGEPVAFLKKVKTHIAGWLTDD